MRFSGVLSTASFMSTASFPQPIKVTVGRNVGSNGELITLAKALSVRHYDVHSIQCDGLDLEEKAGRLITKWIQENGTSATLETFSQILCSANLARLLDPVTSVGPTTRADCDTSEDETALLHEYLRYVIDTTEYVDMIGTVRACGRHPLPLDRVYVGLRIDRTVSYEKAQQAVQLDSEMKTLLASKGISWEQLSPDEKVHLVYAYLSELPLSSFNTSPTEQYQEESDIPIAQAFLENETLVVLGDPGSGKTTMVRWLALKLANAMLDGETNVSVPKHQVWLTSSPDDQSRFDMGPVRLPIFVRISRFADYLTNLDVNSTEANHPLLSFLGSCPHHGSYLVPGSCGKQLFGPSLQQLMKDHLFKGKAAVILDGLDEVTATDVRVSVVKCVEKLMKECAPKSSRSARNQIVITSRIAGYKAANFPTDLVVHGSVQRMNRQAIDKFIDCWMTARYSTEVTTTVTVEQTLSKAQHAATELKRAIYDRHHPAVYMLASNPLLLTLVAMMFMVSRELPKERARLYDNAIDYLLRTWRRDSTKRSYLDGDIFKRSLEQVAFYIHSTNQAGYIRKGDLIKRLMAGCIEAAEKSGVEWRLSEESDVVAMVSTLQMSVGLIVEKVPDCFSFIHLSFQEFLAGCRILADGCNTADMVLDRLSDPRWKEPILLALGHASITWDRTDFNDLLSRLLEKKDSQYAGMAPASSLLVVRALPEFQQGSVDDDVVDGLVDILLTVHHSQLRSECMISRKQVEAALLRLCNNPQYKRQLVSKLESWLSSECRYKQCTVALLTCALNLLSSQIERKICERIECDPPELKMPMHSTLRRLASPDVAQYFQTQTAITDFSSAVDSLISSLRFDHSISTEHICVELEKLQELHKSCSTLHTSSKEAFTTLWSTWLGLWEKIATRFTVAPHLDLSPELGLHGDLQYVRSEALLCSILTQAVIVSSVKLYHDVRRETAELPCNSGTTALFAAAQTINCYLRHAQLSSQCPTAHGVVSDEVHGFIERLTGGLAAMIPISGTADDDTIRDELTQLASSVLSVGVTGTTVCDLLLSWLTATIGTCLKIGLETDEMSHSRDLVYGTLKETANDVERWLQAHLNVEDVPRLSPFSALELKQYIPSMVVEGLKDLMQVSTGEYERIDRAMNVFYDSLELLDMHNKSSFMLALLKNLRKTYHEQRQIGTQCHNQMAGYQLSVLPSRRAFLVPHSTALGISFVGKVQRNARLFKEICKDSSLYRVFVLLYGGISDLGYTATVGSVQRALAYDQAPQSVQMQISELQLPCSSTKTVGEQFQREMKSPRRLALQAELLGSARPILRLNYAYRQSSSLDKLLAQALDPRNSGSTNAVDGVLIQAAKALDSNTVTISERCDAAKCICAAGSTEQVVRYLAATKPFDIQLSTALAESLLACSEPACRVVQQFVSSQNFENILASGELPADSLRSLLSFNVQLGGTVDLEQLCRLVRVAMCPDVKSALEAELLARVVCAGVTTSQLPTASWSLTNRETVDETPSMEAAMAMLSLSQASSIRWCGRLQWLTVWRRRFSLMTRSYEHLFTVDLLFILLAICRKLPKQCDVFLQSVEPVATTPEYHVLWETFRCAVLAKTVQATDWRSLPGMWQDLRTKVDLIQNIFIRGQMLVALLIVCPRRKHDLLPKIMTISDQLLLQNACQSSRLLLWTLLVLPAAEGYPVLDKLERHVSEIASPVDKGNMLAFLSSLTISGHRVQLLLEAVESLLQSALDIELAFALKDISQFVDSCPNSDVHQVYNDAVNGLPTDLLPYARGSRRFVVEGLSPYFTYPRSSDVLLLAARLLDTLSETHSCIALFDEDLLWQAVASGNEQVRKLAQSKLKQTTMSGCLDLSCYSALILHSLMLEGKDEFALEILPYVQVAQIEVIFILKSWLSNEVISSKIFDKTTGVKVKDLFNLFLAEEQGLDSSNTDSVIELLRSQHDICRRRAEQLLDDNLRRYYTAFVEPVWLYNVASKFLALKDAEDLRSIVVLWVFKHMYHNDCDTYSSTLLNTSALVENQTLIRRVFFVDRDVGQLLLNSLVHGNTAPVVKRNLLISLCDICYNYSPNDPTATADFFECLPRICRQFTADSPDELRSTVVYIGTPEMILTQANATVHQANYYMCFESLYTEVTCHVLDTLCFAVKAFNGEEVREVRGIQGTLLRDFRQRLMKDSEKDTCEKKLVRESTALRMLLGAIVSRTWASSKVAFDPATSLTSNVNLEEYDAKVVIVLCNWTDRALRKEDMEEQLIESFLEEDLLLCLAVTSARTPAAFANCVRDRYPDLPDAIAAKAVSNDSFLKRQAAMMVLANFGHLSVETSKCLVSGLAENKFVSYTALKSALRFIRADDKALTYICDCLKGGSALQQAMICRLLSALASNRNLSFEQRSLVLETLDSFVWKLTQDQPIILFLPDAKIFDHPSLATVAGEAIMSSSGIEFDDAPPVPFQLGQPDGEGIYKYRVDETTTPIWYRYCKTMNCWYWTPYENYSCWMPVSTLNVRKGPWAGHKPVAANQHVIRYLHQVNPGPPSDVIAINSDWMPSS